MAHPHNEHRAHHVEKRRVGERIKAYATGGGVHADEASDKKLIRRTVKKSALKMEGEHAKSRMDRRARGGRTKSKGTHVNVIVAPQHAMGGAPGVMPGAGVAMPPRPPMAAPAAPPVAPPMAAGAAPMPMQRPPMAGMPMRARGGSVKSGPAWEEGLKSGTQVQHADGKKDQPNIGRKRVITYKRGGQVPAYSLSGPAHGAKREHPESITETSEVTARRATGGRTDRRLVQFYAGGKVEAPKGVAPATKLPGGSGGGEARLAKEHRAERSYAKAH